MNLTPIYAITPQQLPYPREFFCHFGCGRKHGLGVLYKIVACARMCFSSVRKRRSARTVFRPRRFCQNLRATRANLVFGTDEKRIRTKNKVMQLLRNNCHIRANVLVISVAANGRAMRKPGPIA